MDAAVSPVFPRLANMNKANATKCRACLSGNREFVTLDSKVPELKSARNYGDSFRQCTGLTLNICTAGGYKWPMQMCVRCCRALEVAMHFVELALESDRVLRAEAQSVKPAPASAPELKRKASNELLYWNQYSQEFENFVECYDGTTGPIEENVLYMHGAKMPRLDVDARAANAMLKEDDIILFDVKYDTNNIDAEDENDGSDAKNSETFFDNTATVVESKRNENNNNYHFNNQNGDMSGLPDVECDLIQRALFMTLNDDANSGQTAKELETIESIKATLLEFTESFGSEQKEVTNLPSKTEQVNKVSTATKQNQNDLNIPLLSCNKCKYTHNEAKQLRSHYMSAHNIEMSEDEIIGLTKNQNFKCRPCNSYETKNRANMQKHLIEHHKIDGDFEMYCYEQQNCPACARIFKDQRSARTHYTRMHTASASSSSNSLSNASSPQLNERHVCSACDKVFNQKASLQGHQRFCQVTQPVHCTFCAQQFSSIRRYELHLQQQHAVDTVHECEICRKSFKNADSLTLHRKRHSERHYQCDKCALNYVNAAELKVHYERAHVHEQQVSCGSCGAKFQNSALLREHEQRNHQQKVWRCDNCSFETTSRARLRQHQYEHTGNPYKCLHCKEEFTERSKIRQHSKKVHAVEVSDEQLAEMFRERIGYTNRHDAFSKSNNSLEIPGFSDECFNELKNLGVDYDGITHDLFSNTSSALDNLLDLIP